MKRTREDFTTSKSRHFEDPEVRVKHQNLMQDCRELYMENEAMRKKLKKVRERKAILMAEVRFLRRRCKQLKQDQPVKQLMQPPDTIKKLKGKSNGEKSKKQVSPKHVSLPDLNYSGKVYDETKSSLKRRIPLFDLNQISGEEEEETEAVNNNEKMREEESSSCKRMNNIEQKEMKLSSCRNGGNGTNKRKISWQDPIAALRV